MVAVVRLLAGLLALFATLPAAGDPAWAQSRRGATFVDAPLVRDAQGRFRADVRINGQGPFSFIVDTAASSSAVSRALAAQLQLPSLGRRDIHALNGQMNVEYVLLAQFEVGGVAYVQTEAPVLEPDALFAADGVIGADIAVGRRMTIDFEDERLTVQPASRRSLGRDWYAVQMGQSLGRTMVAEGEIDGVPVKVVFDTGSDVSLGNSALALALSARRGQRIEDAGAVDAVGERVALERFISVGRLQVGQIRVSRFSVLLEDLYIFGVWGLSEQPAILLGMDALSAAGGITLDFRNERMHLRPRRKGRSAAAIPNRPAL